LPRAITTVTGTFMALFFAEGAVHGAGPRNARYPSRIEITALRQKRQVVGISRGTNAIR
jgi:hypothetical protein